MPRYTIFIKDELDPLWQAIDNRSEWIQDKLRQDNLTNEYLKAVKASKDMTFTIETPKNSKDYIVKHVKLDNDIRPNKTVNENDPAK